MATTGTATLDFTSGGLYEASVAVTGQTGIGTNSYVEAWIRLVSTAANTADDARVETLKITAGNIIAGTGFTIYGEVEQGKAHNTYTINWVWT